jgi:hypothetical protein
MNKLHSLFAATFLTLSLNSFAGDCPALSGEYIIGPSEETDFSTITEAFAALNCGGVEGPVSFSIESGTYNERATLSNVRGVSAFNTITFTSQSGEMEDVVISYNTTDATVVLVGTSYITFEHLTFDHQASTYGNCVRVDGEANHLRFKGVKFNGVEMERMGDINATVYFTSIAAKTDIIFDGCEVNNGSIGICKAGISTSIPDNQTTITGTVFFDQHEAGMMLSNEAAPVITSNIINTLSANSRYTGISLANVSGSLVVNRNTINVANSATGILMMDCIAHNAHPGQIISNTIGISARQQAYGIRVSGTTNHQVIDLNIIKLMVNKADATTQAFYHNTSSGNNISMMNSTFYDLSSGIYHVHSDSFKPDSGNKTNPSMTASAHGGSLEKGSVIR